MEQTELREAENRGETSPGPKKQRRLEKHPVLGALLLILWVWIFLQLGGLFVGLVGGAAEMMGYPVGWLTPAGQLVSAGMAFLALLIHKRWFRPEFAGCLTRKTFGLGLALAAADLVYVVGGLFTESFSLAGLTLNNLTLALAAGVTEEVMFRAIPASYLMRQWREKKKLPAAVLLTAAVFGLIHATNLFLGADPGATVVQVVGAFGMGVLFGAVFLRTGNIGPCMVIHFLHDALAFLQTESIQDGVMVSSMTAADVVMTLLFAVIFVVLGFWIIRPAKRPEIVRLWDEKWSRNTGPAVPAPETTE